MGAIFADQICYNYILVSNYNSFKITIFVDIRDYVSRTLHSYLDGSLLHLHWAHL